MRPSPDSTTTTSPATIGGAITSLDTCAVHCALPSTSNARTSPWSVPTTTCEPPAPGPASSFLPALMRHTTRPVAGSTRISVPSMAAAYTASGVMAGANPGAALPTSTRQLTLAVVFAVSAGSGPGLFEPPVSQSNDGGGIVGSVSELLDRLLQPATSTAVA